MADVASVYTNILQYDELLKLQKEKIDIQTKLCDTYTKKYKRGIIDSNQYNNSQTNLETVKNQYESIKKQQKLLLMQLAVLTGISPSEIDKLKRGSIQTIEYSKPIPEYIESDVIFSRPDVMAVEKQLEKAKIQAWDYTSPGTFKFIYYI